MKSSRYQFGLILMVFLLAGCGEDGSTATKQDKQDAAATESVFEPMLQAIDKAKAVEDLTANRTEELDKELEKSQ